MSTQQSSMSDYGVSNSFREIVRDMESCYQAFSGIGGSLTNSDEAVVITNPIYPLFAFNCASSIKTTCERSYILVKEVEALIRQNVPGLDYVHFLLSPLTEPPSFASKLVDLGFTLAKSWSFMAYTATREPEPTNPYLKIHGVNEQTLHSFTKIANDVFGVASETRLTVNRGYRAQLMSPDCWAYLGYLNDRPVGTIQLFSKHNVMGIYNVATEESERRKGVATNLISKAVKDFISRRDRLLWLFTEADGAPERLYAKLGFKREFIGLSYQASLPLP